MMRRWPMSQARWERTCTDRMPGFIAREMLLKHGQLVGKVGPDSTSPLFIANQWLGALKRDLLKSKIWNAFDEDEIRDHAESYARACADMPQLAKREAFAAFHGVAPPPGKFLSDRYEARAHRLADPLWWRRKLRVVWTRSAEEGVRRMGVVRKGKAPYVSDSGVDHRRGQKRRMRDYCEAHVAINELGEQLSLFDVQQGSIANPTLRRGEFMTRVRGFEELAEFRKDDALFFTLTTPSHFHPQLAAGGANPTHDPRQTVRTAQEWLCKYWARFRAAIHRAKVLMYGFRIAEPHHDGTPHWHGLLFCRPADVAIVERELRKHFLRDRGDDPGAREHRVSLVRIDAAKGSAAGYIAKYVAKNIDGKGAIGAAEGDETGAPVNESVARVDAWAAIHGIRQFQQLGGPPVGLWREARRVRDEEEVKDRDLARCCRNADRGDWHLFCRSVTWDAGTRRSSLKLWREETGELTKYGECRGPRIVGLRFASACVITRPHQWRIERKGRSHASDKGDSLAGATWRGGSGSFSESLPPLGPVAITVRTIAGSGRIIQGRYAEMSLPCEGHPGGWLFVDRHGGAGPPGNEKSDHLH